MARISVYIREKTDGVWRYRRIREGRGCKTGDLTPPFFTRRRTGGKQVWKGLYAETFAQAKKEATQLNAQNPVEPSVLATAQPEIPRTANRIPPATAVDTYLEQKSGKSQKTIYQYKRTLNEFQQVVGKKVRYLDEVTENVLRTYKRSMEAEGYAGKTIDTRLNIVEGRYEKRKKVEVSCKDRPVCEHFYLHRFRKTCATRWHEAGISIRTIQNWLGHKSLETTMIYLGVTGSEKLRSNINAAFFD